MNSEDILVIIIKTFFIIFLFLYFLVGILIARQVWLMNRAIKTKLSGCLNLAALIHIFLILAVLVVAIIV
jgi:hypothetical protein